MCHDKCHLKRTGLSKRLLTIDPAKNCKQRLNHFAPTPIGVQTPSKF